MSRQIVIDPRFRGPPRSANGGYACGVLAETVPGVVTANLYVPPPLETPMALQGDGRSGCLRAGEVIVGEARADALTLEVPEAPSLEEATDAVSGYAGFDDHPFPECFVCGPDREPGDGLRLFPGRTSGRGLVAAPWTPDVSLVGEDGSMAERVVWSALDCPSYFAIASSPRALLAGLTAKIERTPEVGEKLIAFGWHESSKGRKHACGSGLATADGELIASAAALWIEPKSGLPV